MSNLEANKQLCRDYFKAFKAADQAWWDKHIAPTFVRHDTGLPFVVKGPSGLKQLSDVLNPGIPDLELPIETVVAEGDKVLVQLRVVGTHGAEMLGISATGKKLDVQVMDLFKIAPEGDVIIEHWALLDNLMMLKQLGVVES